MWSFIRRKAGTGRRPVPPAAEPPITDPPTTDPPTTDPPGRPEVRDIDVYEASYLRGGRTAVAETAMAALYLAGRLTVVSGSNWVTVRRDGHDLGDEFQAAVVARMAEAESCVALGLRDDTAYHPAVERLVERLIEDGLIVAVGGRHLMNRRYPTESGVAALRRFTKRPPFAAAAEPKLVEVALYGLSRLPPGAVLPVGRPSPAAPRSGNGWASGRHWAGTGTLGGFVPAAGDGGSGRSGSNGGCGGGTSSTCGGGGDGGGCGGCGCG
ncbi:TIGR04222 domain-containing membrane protein [Streptomyces sp. NBC_01351]|uniref:TIGR04222 domain-containing membrane protein n=1 Tax=Streptomyces sp. NBC_01351 TaxID=2903833 RepID=UPI002E3293AE|nr:TIGR04222 domain-containing membrane protein [Streptomyces sp. NBC_01351]